MAKKKRKNKSYKNNNSSNNKKNNNSYKSNNSSNNNKNNNKNNNSSNNNTNNNSSGNNSNNGSTYNMENLSDDDIQSLYLLDIQLKGTLAVIYAQFLLVQANFQGREVIYNKYKSDNENSNNEITAIVPDKTVLEATYIFFILKLLFIQIAFDRYNDVYNKKLKGEFPYSLEPNILINTANLLDLVSCTYYIKAAEEILARDNNQPVFGIR